MWHYVEMNKSSSRHHQTTASRRSPKKLAPYRRPRQRKPIVLHAHDIGQIELRRSLIKPGDIPTIPTNATPQGFIFEVAAFPPPDRCVIWPFAMEKTGYGVLKYNGKKVTASRMALFLFTGYDPVDLDAAHGPCHNRACCNPHPDHGMRWATRQQNMMDMRRDGSARKSKKRPPGS